MARGDSVPAEWVGISPCVDCKRERHLKWCYDCRLWWTACCTREHVCDPDRREHVTQLNTPKE